MKRYKIIIEIWKYGMAFPNFPINELEDYLKTKTKSIDDINFGLAYVRKNFVQNQNLDEYLIDQNSISNYISILQKRTAYWALGVSIAAFIITTISAILTFQNKNDFIPSQFFSKDNSNNMDINSKVECLHSSIIMQSENDFMGAISLDPSIYLNVSGLMTCYSDSFSMSYLPIWEQVFLNKYDSELFFDFKKYQKCEP